MSPHCITTVLVLYHYFPELKIGNCEKNSGKVCRRSTRNERFLFKKNEIYDIILRIIRKKYVCTRKHHLKNIKRGNRYARECFITILLE